MKSALAVLIGLMASMPAGAVPAPPASPQAIEAASAIRDGYRTRSPDALIDRLTPSVSLFTDGSLTAQGKDAVAKELRKQFSAEIEVKLMSVSAGKILSAETIDTRGISADLKRPIDCCEWSRAVLYTMDSEQRITRIDALQNPIARWEK